MGSACFGLFVRVPEGKTPKNNIRLVRGTPIDSRRFRQAVNLERKNVLTSIVVSIVKTCTRFATITVLTALVVAIAAGFYTAGHFEINTDINTLISPDLDWRQRDIQFDDAFDRDRTILAVVEAPTPELTSSASAALDQRLSGDKQHFESVEPLGSGEFFEKNGLLFLPASQVARFTSQFESAAPLIEILAGDPSLRGLT